MELTEHHPEKAWYQMCGPEYQCALRLKVVSAVGLEKQVIFLFFFGGGGGGLGVVISSYRWENLHFGSPI